MSRLDVKRVQKRSTNVVLSKHQIWLKKRMIPRKELKYMMWVVHIHSYISITACKIRDMELTISFKTNKYLIQKRLFEFVATVTIYPDGKSFCFFNSFFFCNSYNLLFQITMYVPGSDISYPFEKIESLCCHSLHLIEQNRFFDPIDNNVKP